MFDSTLRRCLAVTILALFALGSAHAAEPNIAVLRVESLDAVLADVEKTLALADVKIGGRMIEQQLFTMLGIGDLSWVDRSRPMALVYPMQGMMLGEKGILALLPVTDPDAAMASLETQFPSIRTDEQGFREFGEEGGEPSIVVARNGYLIAGKDRNLVAAMDPDFALQVDGLPPGSIALDVHLEPVAPMAQMGLQMGRNALEEEWSKEMDPNASEEGSTAGDLDPEQARAFMDIYFTFLQDLLNNASRLQISLEVGSEAFVLHKRVTARPGSTMDGLIRAQKGGLPDAARLIDSGDGFAAAAGQITLTTAFTEAMKTYVDAYVEGMAALEPKGEDAADIAALQAWVPVMTAMGDSWADCYRGDFAGSMSFGEGGDLRLEQAVGIKDLEACQKIMTSLQSLMGELPDGPGGEPVVTMTENALSYGGVQAWRQVTRPDLPVEEGDAGQEWVRSWYGENGMVTYTGLSSDYMFSATGQDAEATFKGLVDRAGGGAGNKPSGGLAAASFEPVAVGPGFFVYLDVARLLEVLPEADDNDPEYATVMSLFREIPEGSARIVEGLRFEPDAVRVEIAVPFPLVRAIAVAAAQSEDGEEPVPEGEAIEPESAQGAAPAE
jgi:hypothetical protein